MIVKCFIKLTTDYLNLGLLLQERCRLDDDDRMLRRSGQGLQHHEAGRRVSIPASDRQRR